MKNIIALTISLMFSSPLSDDLVRLMREIGREDAANALIAGCPMYRIGRDDEDFFLSGRSVSGDDDAR